MLHLLKLIVYRVVTRDSGPEGVRIGRNNPTFLCCQNGWNLNSAIHNQCICQQNPGQGNRYPPQLGN